MSQHDFDIANQTASNARADINNALKALVTLSSGASAPSTTYAYMLWLDTNTNAGSDVSALKIRSSADDAWITLAFVDSNTDNLAYAANKDVINTNGVVQGNLSNQTTGTWETGTGTTETLVSPAKIKAAIDANVPTGYTDADARDAQAGHSVGDVGSYAFLSLTNSGGGVVVYNPGDTLAGASLKYSGSGTSSSTSPSGTWRCMGFLSVAELATESTLWLRIS